MKPSEHRRRPPRVRNVLWTFALLAITGCLVGVANLYHVQGEYQKCVAQYLTDDSEARTIRSDASANTIQALVMQSVTLSVALDPKKQPPSEKDVAAALSAIGAVPAESKKYDASISNFPYPDYVCGGTE